MNFIEATESALKKYARFSGRASRSEYWYFFLFNMGVAGLAVAIDHYALPDYFVSKKFSMGFVQTLASLVLLAPSIALAARRFHDSNRRGWWWLVVFTVIGIIPVIYWICKKGDAGANRYGEPVKGAPGAALNGPALALACLAAPFALYPIFYPPVATLAAAAQLGRLDRVNHLIEKGADLNEEGPYGVTPLVGALLMQQDDVAKVLIEKGADVNLKSIQGLSPLVMATVNNKAAIVALMLKHGARVEDPDTGGHPALDIAVQKGFTDIAAMLQTAADK